MCTLNDLQNLSSKHLFTIPNEALCINSLGSYSNLAFCMWLEWASLRGMLDHIPKAAIVWWPNTYPHGHFSLVMSMASFNWFLLISHFIRDLCAMSDKEELLVNYSSSTYNEGSLYIGRTPVTLLCKSLDCPVSWAMTYFAYVAPSSHLRL